VAFEHGRPNQCPEFYVGVDLNQLPQYNRKRVRLYGEFDIIKKTNWKSLLDMHGPFDVIACFEVIEHMSKEDGQKMLKVFKQLLAPTGTILLSTPVYNGNQARNHIWEYTISELETAFIRAGLTVDRRFGTFMNLNAFKKAATPAERELCDKLREYYDSEVIATIFAPLYPDHARNNLWIVEHGV
jgi:cyclopropane fatty-acyl-phospholipid synthase-like methyltransferase